MIVRVLPLVLMLVAQTARPPLYIADPRERMAKALELADVDDIRVLINWGSNDCEPCKKFDETTKSPEVRDTKFSSQEYHVVNVDVGKLDKNLDLVKQYGVALQAELLPMLTVLDEHGKVIAQASAPDFRAPGKADAFDPAKVAAFFRLHQAPAPDAKAPFEAAVNRAKAEGKLVFVWFSAPW